MAMSGGFTLSGGEPLMQHRFAVKLFAAARAIKLGDARHPSAEAVGTACAAFRKEGLNAV